MTPLRAAPQEMEDIPNLQEGENKTNLKFQSESHLVTKKQKIDKFCTSSNYYGN